MAIIMQRTLTPTMWETSRHFSYTLTLGGILLSLYFPKEKLRPKEVNKPYQSPDLLAVAELGFQLISGSRSLFD